MTRAVGIMRLVLIVGTLAGGYFAFAPAPYSATASPTGVLEPRAGTDLWRSGAPESRAVASFAARSDSGSTPDPATGTPSESPTPRVSPSRFLAGKPKGSAAASPRPSAMRAPRPVASGTANVAGTMSWYCLPGRSACTVGYPANDCGGPTPRCYGAAGPALRAALGNWRGRTVIVSTGRASVAVRLIDWCSCPGGRVLDGYASVWFGLGVPLSAGVVDVEVSW